MDQPQTQLRPCAYQLLQPDCLLMPPQAYPDSEGYSSVSPASSTDSYGLSPTNFQFSLPQELYGFYAPQAESLPVRRPPLLPKGRKERSRVGGTQRCSASEREKMRMRNLSKALQGVRRYLPPSVAPPGKSLTKIETLQLTIRYISYLSDLLGLSEEALVQRKQAQQRKCHLCPEGLGCGQGRRHPACARSPTQLPGGLPRALPCQPSPYCGESPIDFHRAQFSLGESWFVPEYSPEPLANSQQHRACVTGSEPQMSSQGCGDTRVSPPQSVDIYPRVPPAPSGDTRALGTQPYLLSADSVEMSCLPAQPHLSPTTCGEMRTLPEHLTEVQPDPSSNCPSAELRATLPQTDAEILALFPDDFNILAIPRDPETDPKASPCSSPASPDLGFCQDILDGIFTDSPDFDVWTTLEC